MSCREHTDAHGAPRWLALTLVATALLAGPLGQASLAQDEGQAAAEAAYDVPIPAWVAGVANDLKQEFVVGLARQAVGMAESSATEEVKLLVDSADGMVSAANKVEDTMSTIGTIDSSFGIPGVSRLVTAEGAVRDTLFGFVVWHESAAGESKEIATNLEASVDRMKELSLAARSNARKLSDNADDVKAALASEDYAAIASSAGVVTEATDQLAAIADEAEQVSGSIEEIVWKVQDGGGSQLDKEWQQVLLAVSDTRRLASKIRPALTSLRKGSGASEALSSALQGMVESIDIMDSAVANESGYFHYPPALFEKDVEVVKTLERSTSGEGDVTFPEETASSIQWLLSKVVMADRALAERAVEYTSTQVGRAMDRLEDQYKRTSGFDESLKGRERVQAYEPVDSDMRKNADLQAARTAIRAARVALDAGKTGEAAGPGSLSSALENYRDAWVYSLAAGASAVKSLKSL